MSKHILDARKYKETKSHKAQIEAANALFKDIFKDDSRSSFHISSAAPVPKSPKKEQEDEIEDITSKQKLIDIQAGSSSQKKVKKSNILYTDIPDAMMKLFPVFVILESFSRLNATTPKSKRSWHVYGREKERSVRS